MGKLEKGQGVRITDEDDKRYGQVGIIHRISEVNGKVAAYLVAFKFEGTCWFLAEHVEDAHAPEVKVKAGDRVRIKAVVGPWGAQEGTVVGLGTPSKGPSALVDLDGGERVPFRLVEIEVTDPAPVVKPKLPEDAVVGEEIAFEQIIKGDRVRCVREFEDGFVITMEGVAEVLREEANGEKAWRTGSHCVATTRLGIAVKQTHILVEREEPKDWFVFSRNILSGGVTVQTLGGKTKTEAERLAEKWTRDQPGICGDRRVFWAQKVSN